MTDIPESWIKRTLYENGRIYIHDVDNRFKDSKSMALITLKKLYDYEHKNLLSSKFETLGDIIERVFYPIRDE